MTAQLRKVCVVSGTRAEYGLLYWLLKEIEQDAALALQLVVTGAHLGEKFGNTAEEIIADGFIISERVDIELADDTATGISRSMGLCTIGMGQAFERLKPDIVVVLGDRFEIFASAQAAMVARIPIAHIHGGETTQYAIDEAMRHAITKMSHLHFAAAAAYASRIVQMGEQPDHVFMTGAIGLDHFTRMEPLQQNELEEFLDMSLEGPVFLVTYHPVTLSAFDPGLAATELCEALATFPDAKIIMTGVNADTGNNSVRRVLEKFSSENPDRVRLIESLGSQRYLSLMRLADAVIGNSSSGLIEAPVAGVPTLNIGKRQQGRLRAASVVDCDEDRGSIGDAINLIISAEFRKTVEGSISPYGAGDASRKIAAVLREINLQGILYKRFHDLDTPT